MYIKHLKNIVFCLFFVFLMGSIKGTKDAMQFHNGDFVEVTGLDKSFWNNPAKTWCNKYVSCEDRREKFKGSSTVFVAFTDGWHLLDLALIFTALLAVVCYIQPAFWYFRLIDILVLLLIRQAGFYLTYEFLF